MYCNANDVALLLGIDEFNNNTNPSITRVNEIINLITAEIDFNKNMYNFNSNINENLFRKKCAVGVAGTILLTYMNNTQTSGTQANEYIKEYKEFLNSFKAKRQPWSDFFDE